LSEYFKVKAKEELKNLIVEFNFVSYTNNGVLRANAIGTDEKGKIVKVILWGRNLTPKNIEMWKGRKIEPILFWGYDFKPLKKGFELRCKLCGNVWRKRGRGMVRCPACQSFLGYFDGGS
jgi:hypothetical protein